MAKKGGIQKLQEDISTDEELNTFMDRPGLLVFDVFSEWCGPCLGMVGSLRKIKMELGGDNLHLAICKSDTITALNRFCKKSEPTWLFVVNGKAVNIMFGTQVPKLMNMITKELDCLNLKSIRSTYEITELQPIEVEQLNIKTEAIEKAGRIIREMEMRKRISYLNSVTDTILENMPDIGITVFGPQVNRDMFKKLAEPAESLKMQCKDRKIVLVTINDFNTINFACKNPLAPEVINQLHEKELLMCFWKIDESLGTVPDVLMTYAHELIKETVAPPDDFFDEEHIVPPIIAAIKVKMEIEIQDGEEWEEVVSEEDLKLKKSKAAIVQIGDQEASYLDIEPDDLESEEEEEEEEAETVEFLPSVPIDMKFGFELDFDNDVGEDEEENEEVLEEGTKKLTRLKTVKIPPIWVPLDKRTHAALIYLFFRGQTAGFLPPDPKPKPPHVIMAFDAYKKKDLINIINRYKDDIPLYGYFSSDDPDEAQFIANTTEKYNTLSHQTSDKIVLKVNKVQSNTMLALVSYGPTYVSPNIEIGHDEALKFFPEHYKSAEQEAAEIAAVDAEKPQKKKVSKKEGGDDILPFEMINITEDSTQLKKSSVQTEPVFTQNTEQAEDSLPKKDTPNNVLLTEETLIDYGEVATLTEGAPSTAIPAEEIANVEKSYNKAETENVPPKETDDVREINDLTTHLSTEIMPTVAVDATLSPRNISTEISLPLSQELTPKHTTDLKALDE